MNGQHVNFNANPVTVVKTPNREIPVFSSGENMDAKTIESFGEEWKAYHHFDEKELVEISGMYFDILPAEALKPDSTVLEVGCGSGRFIWYLRKQYDPFVTGVDPSDAVFAADELLGKDEKVQIVKATSSNMPFADESFDFVYSIGVLHHIPETARAMEDCTRKLKKGGYFLTYIYYDLDNRGKLFRGLYDFSNFFRKGISRLPQKTKKIVCDILAVAVYMPWVTASRILKLAGVSKSVREKIPLHGYEDRSFYVIRNDSLDRFGTPLEQRFTKAQITEMMEKAGLSDIKFSDKIPYWHAIGRKV